ncbi:MAG: universal stress protein [Dehalococcoidia bacterium]
MPQDPEALEAPAKILVPLDGASPSEAILPYVEGMARQLDARLILFRAVTKSAGGDAVAAAEEYLDDVAGHFRGRGMGVATAVERATPSSGITAVAEEYDADIIAMTAHGRPGGRKDLIGSTAHRVLQNSRRPLLLLRAENSNWISPQSIIVGLDGSDLASLSLRPAVGFAKTFRSDLVLVRAAAPPDPLGGAVRYYGTVDDHAERYLQDVAAELAVHKLNIVTHVGTRPPEQELLAAADARPGSIIVLTTRGMSGKPNVLLGSTTDRVVRSQSHPVLAIPAVPG